LAVIAWRRGVHTLAGAWLAVVASAASGQAVVIPTMESIFVFDSEGNTTFQGAPVTAGAVIDAYDPDGVHCGTTTVGDNGDATGYFAVISVYKDAPGDPDEGASYGDKITFRINDLPAEVIRGGPVIWTGNGAIYDISLSVPDLVTAIAFSQQTEGTAPQELVLRPNYPNPFNSMTTISYELGVESEVVLAIHNLAGQRIATFASGWRQAGTHTLWWDGRDAGGREVAGGVYVYRVQAGNEVETRKLSLVR